MNEVDRRAVDVGEELRMRVETGLDRRPVEREPGRDEVTQVVRGHARRHPAGSIGAEPRSPQPIVQVGQLVVGDRHAELARLAHTFDRTRDRRPVPARGSPHQRAGEGSAAEELVRAAGVQHDEGRSGTGFQSLERSRCWRRAERPG